MNDIVLDFLMKCHVEMSDIFDNSLNIPIEIKMKYEKEGVEVEREWADYIKYKFIYLSLWDHVKEDLDMPDKETLQTLRSRGKSYLEKFVPEWKENKEKEKIVYYYRISQIHWTTVHRRWYSEQIDECFEWCKKRRCELLELDKNALDSKWHERLTEIYREIGNKPYADFFQDRNLMLICLNILQSSDERINEIHSSLAKGPLSLDTVIRKMPEKCQDVLQEIQGKFQSIPLEKAMDESKQPLDNFLVDLSLHLTQALYTEMFDETEVIRQFILKLKEKFMCEVCDFLQVSEDGEKILWRVATVNLKDLSIKYRKMQEKDPEALKKEIQNRESYGRGIGISGSILLQSADIGRNTWFHIGSNDVENDPRQSKKHKHAYEQDLYPGVLRSNKRINNFWMFPIFKRNKLVGTFRVVNKLIEEKKLQPGGWPYYTRVQLSLIAQWFSKFLETTELQIKMKEDFLTAIERNRKIDLMIERLKLQWIKRDRLQAFLRHLTGDIAKKVEYRPIGCCILITEAREDEMALKELSIYPSLDPDREEITENYDKLNDYHDIIDPLRGAYLFDQNGKFRRIAQLAYKDGDEIRYGYDAIKSVTEKYPKTLCLLLSRDTKIMQVYSKGEKTVEIFLSEGTGEWRFRFPEEVFKLMISYATSCDKKILEAICKACMELSYRGLGAIIVIGDVPEEKFDFSILRVPMKSTYVQSMGTFLLVEFAKIDGAVFIENNGLMTRFGSIVKPKGRLPKIVPLFPGRGGRHETGQIISLLAPKSMVMVVSQNRSISIIANGGKDCIKDL